MVDLPLSSLFLDLVMGKTPTLRDVSRINDGLYKTLEDLKEIAQRRAKIIESQEIDQESKDWSI